jgi:hypothetical protein
MLTPEEAQARLEAQRLPELPARRKQAVARLPSLPRTVGEALLEQRPYVGAPKAVPEGDAFDRASAKVRLRLFAALFPKLDQHLERYWQLRTQLPYQSELQRRAFRAPRNPELTRSTRLQLLAALVALLAGSGLAGSLDASSRAMG